MRVVWGTKDRILPSEVATAHWRGALIGAKWVELDGLGHLPHLEDPDRIARLVFDCTASTDRMPAAA